MVTAILVIGVLNLGLGCGLALLMEQPWQLALPAWPTRLGRSAPPPRATEAPSAGDAASDTARDAPGVQPDWQASLRKAQITAGGPVEAVLWAVHLELPALRSQLDPIDRVLQTRAKQLPDGLLGAAADAWMGQLNLWASILQANLDQARHAAVGSELAALLLDSAYDAKHAAGELVRMAANSPFDVAGAAPQLAAFYRTFDRLKVETDAHLAAILRQEKRLALIRDGREEDGSSGAYSRLGLESLVEQWWDADRERVRLVSGLLVDIDRMARVNDTVGTTAGDAVAAALGRSLRTMVRRERGFDRVARYSGQSYFLFLGDTAAKNAASGAERIRQTIEVASFQLGDRPLELTVSIGVAEAGKSESLPEFLARIEACVAAAKTAGRNRTCLDCGAGPTSVTLPQYQVERREIPVK